MRCHAARSFIATRDWAVEPVDLLHGSSGATVEVLAPPYIDNGGLSHTHTPRVVSTDYSTQCLLCQY